MAQRFALSTVVLLTLAALLAGCRPIQAQVAPGQTEPASAENSEGYPAQLALPNMYMPEGIAISSDGTAYVGSIATGAIYQIDLRTGEGKMLVEPQEGHSLGGLAYDERTGLLFAAGGGKGNALIYDTATGEQRQDIQFVEDGGLVNDVTITDRAVYFSDSLNPLSTNWRSTPTARSQSRWRRRQSHCQANTSRSKAASTPMVSSQCTAASTWSWTKRIPDACIGLIPPLGKRPRLSWTATS